MACRRRETSGTNVSIFCYIFFSSSSSSSSFWDLCLSRSHIENQKMLLPASRDDVAGQIWGLYRSGKQIKPDPVSRDDVAAKIWGLYRSGKQTTPDPALRPSSSYKNRPLWNGEREQCFIISLYLTSSTKLSWNRASELLHQPNDIIGQTSEQDLGDTSNESRSGLIMAAATLPLPLPSTLTPAPPAPGRRSMPSTMTPAKPPCLTLPSTENPANTPMYERPPLDLTMGMTTGETLILQMGCILGMGLDRVWLDGLSLLLGFLTSGPLRVLSRPTSDLVCPTQSTDWPRDRKVLAQHLKRAIEDLFHTAASFQSLSFRFIPRSQNTLVDDLAKNAIRSMTSGYSSVL